MDFSSVVRFWHVSLLASVFATLSSYPRLTTRGGASGSRRGGGLRSRCGGASGSRRGGGLRSRYGGGLHSRGGWRGRSCAKGNIRVNTI